MKAQSATSPAFQMGKRLIAISLVVLPTILLQQPAGAKRPLPTPTATPTERTHSGMAEPVVAKMDQIYTPVPTPTPWPTRQPTPTIDPADPLKWNPHHIRAKAALDSFHVTLLPVEHDTVNHVWIFRWKQAWAPPVLDNLPKLTLLPRGIPYMLRIHFVIRPNSFDPLGGIQDRYPLADKNEVRMADSELSSGEWTWTVRAEYICLDFKEFTPWSQWQVVDIKK